MAHLNGLIPTSKFFSRINLTVKEYFDLDVIPFPLVLPFGDVVYFDEELRLFTSKRSNDRTDLYDVKILQTRLSEIFKSDSFYIDTRSFNWGFHRDGQNYFSEFTYRNDSLKVDKFIDVSSNSCLFQTQTTEDELEIYHEYSTGKEDHDFCSLGEFSRPNYQFSSFDLVDNTLEFLKYFDESSILFYDEKNKVFTRSPITTQQSETVMTQSVTQSSTRSKKATSIVSANKTAIIAATKLEVGGLALDLIVDQVSKGIPEAFRPFIVTNPLFKIAVANAVNLLVLQTNIEDPKLLILNDAMMTKSYASMLESFDLTSLLSTVLTQIPAGKIKALSDE